MITACESSAEKAAKAKKIREAAIADSLAQVAAAEKAKAIADSTRKAEALAKLMTTEKAIALAEKWIAEQAYTNDTTAVKVSKIVFEEGEFASDTMDIVKNRHNTIRSKAIGAKEYGEKSWAVGFPHINQENNIVRAVLIDSIGENVKMAAKDVRADWIMSK
jgi:formate dehydrogenase assembly factor FdhD